MRKIADLSIVKKHYRGKVRDIYDLGDKLLIITSDRISAFDVVFPDIIPNKGKILNQISVFFFKKTKEIIDNHFITDEIAEYPQKLQQFEDELKHRSMLVKKTRVIPFECIVRGYITGSAWRSYKKTGKVNGIKLPEDLKKSQKLDKYMFTPSTKAEEGHDENISYETMKERIDENIAEYLKEKSLELFSFAHDYLNERDIIIADTKFEFGSIGPNILLIDELFTPDSSRFWDKNDYKVGESQDSYDKQFIRDYLEEVEWSKEPPAPKLPQEIIEKTYQKYSEAYKKITGENELKW